MTPFLRACEHSLSSQLPSECDKLFFRHPARLTFVAIPVHSMGLWRKHPWRKKQDIHRISTRQHNTHRLKIFLRYLHELFLVSKLKAHKWMSSWICFIIIIIYFLSRWVWVSRVGLVGLNGEEKAFALKNEKHKLFSLLNLPHVAPFVDGDLRTSTGRKIVSWEDFHSNVQCINEIMRSMFCGFELIGSTSVDRECLTLLFDVGKCEWVWVFV